MNAIGYFVEGAKRNGMRRSVGDQNRTFLDFCAQRGFEAVGTFQDMGAADTGPGFQQMLAFLQRNDRGFAVVVADSLGVLGTDLGQSAIALLQLESAGVRVVSAHNGAELAKELLETWADRGEGTPVSERVRSAMRKKAVRGEVLGRPPYGYQVGPRRRLELVPDEALIVRYIYRLYLQEEMGIRKIAGQLNSENIPTRRGGRWSMVTVRDILRNRSYLGTYTRFGVKVAGSHPPLVSPEDFRRVQDRLQSHQVSERTRTVTPFLLSGLVYCARCGNRLIGVSRRQKWTTKAGEEHSAAYRYYQCESRTNQSTCEYNTQRAAELEARVRALLLDDSSATRVRRAGNTDSYLLDVATQVEKVEARVRKNRREIEELVADTAHGHISLERMRALGFGLAGERQAVLGDLAAAKARVAAHESEAERRKHLEDSRQRLATHWEHLEFEALQAAVREVVDRVEVDRTDARLFLRS